MDASEKKFSYPRKVVLSAKKESPEDSKKDSKKEETSKKEKTPVAKKKINDSGVKWNDEPEKQRKYKTVSTPGVQPRPFDTAPAPPRRYKVVSSPGVQPRGDESYSPRGEYKSAIPRRKVPLAKDDAETSDTERVERSLDYTESPLDESEDREFIPPMSNAVEEYPEEDEYFGNDFQNHGYDTRRPLEDERIRSTSRHNSMHRREFSPRQKMDREPHRRQFQPPQESNRYSTSRHQSMSRRESPYYSEEGFGQSMRNRNPTMGRDENVGGGRFAYEQSDDVRMRGYTNRQRQQSRGGFGDENRGYGDYNRRGFADRDIHEEGQGRRRRAFGYQPFSYFQDRVGKLRNQGHQMQAVQRSEFEGHQFRDRSEMGRNAEPRMQNAPNGDRQLFRPGRQMMRNGANDGAYMNQDRQMRGGRERRNNGMNRLGDEYRGMMDDDVVPPNSPQRHSRMRGDYGRQDRMYHRGSRAGHQSFGRAGNSGLFGRAQQEPMRQKRMGPLFMSRDGQFQEKQRGGYDTQFDNRFGNEKQKLQAEWNVDQTTRSPRRGSRNPIVNGFNDYVTPNAARVSSHLANGDSPNLAPKRKGVAYNRHDDTHRMIGGQTSTRRRTNGFSDYTTSNDRRVGMIGNEQITPRVIRQNDHTNQRFSTRNQYAQDNRGSRTSYISDYNTPCDKRIGGFLGKFWDN